MQPIAFIGTGAETAMGSVDDRTRMLAGMAAAGQDSLLRPIWYRFDPTPARCRQETRGLFSGPKRPSLFRHQPTNAGSRLTCSLETVQC
jgi:hypothetical protein